MKPLNLVKLINLAPHRMVATESVDGIQRNYIYIGGYGKTICGCNHTTGVVIIPSTLGGHPVTSVGDCAFSGCNGLTSVTIPNGVTEIGYRAFYGCSVLTNPDSVTFIGDYAPFPFKVTCY